MMRRKTLIMVLALALALAGAALGGLAYRHWANSPRYALQQMALALKTKNTDDFFNYLDLQDIFNNYIAAANEEQEKAKDPEGDDLNRLARKTGRKFARHFLPKLFTALEPQIRQAVADHLVNLDNGQILGIAAAATVAQIERTGEEAQVTVIDPRTGKPFRFQMRRRAADGRWRIVAVNYEDTKSFYQQEIGKSGNKNSGPTK